MFMNLPLFFRRFIRFFLLEFIIFIFFFLDQITFHCTFGSCNIDFLLPFEFENSLRGILHQIQSSFTYHYSATLAVTFHFICYHNIGAINVISHHSSSNHTTNNRSLTRTKTIENYWKSLRSLNINTVWIPMRISSSSKFTIDLTSLMISIISNPRRITSTNNHW